MGIFDRLRTLAHSSLKGKETLAARKDTYIATEHATAPLDSFMMRLLAEELPMLDSADQRRITQILEEYTGPVITSQEELPAEIRQIMDL